MHQKPSKHSAPPSDRFWHAKPPVAWGMAQTEGDVNMIWGAAAPAQLFDRKGRFFADASYADIALVAPVAGMPQGIRKACSRLQKRIRAGVPSGLRALLQQLAQHKAEISELRHRLSRSPRRMPWSREAA